MEAQEWLERFARDGCAIVPAVLSDDEVAGLIAAVDRVAGGPTVLKRGASAYGMRDLLDRVPEVAALAHSAAVRDLVVPVLGPGAFVARGLWFDKSAGANWDLPWHRDRTIAVRARRDTPGFHAWTLKHGVPHVLPPLDVLRGMMTVRLHLDDVDEDNGPLEVLPGSHRVEEDDADDVARWRGRVAPQVCLVTRGGAVLMRPLLLHASGTARRPRHRRTIHLEFAANELPGGLRWWARREADRSLAQ